MILPAARATRAPRRWTSSRRIRSTPRSACGAAKRAEGTVKITHEKPARPDANAVGALDRADRRRHRGQGIFIGNDAGNPTTGPLLNIRNGGPDAKRLVLTADGKVQLPVQGPLGGLVIGSDASLYRSAEGVLATDGAIAVADGVVLTSVDKAVASGAYTVAQVAQATTIAIGDRRRPARAEGGRGDLGERHAGPDLALDVQHDECRDAVREDRSEVGRGLQEQPADQRVAGRRRAASRVPRSRASSISCG